MYVDLLRNLCRARAGLSHNFLRKVSVESIVTTANVFAESMFWP